MPEGDFIPNDDSERIRRLNEVSTHFQRPQNDSESRDFSEEVPGTGLIRGLDEVIAGEIELRRSQRQAVDIGSDLGRGPGEEHFVCESVSKEVRLAVTDPLESETMLYAGEVAGSTRQKGPTAIDGADHDQIPKVLGRFRVEKVIGKGAFGIVYLATDPKLGERKVALKVPRPERFESESERRDFIRDAERTALVNHPGIVTIYDIATEEGIFFIVQEYMPGGDLKKRLQNGGVTVTKAVAWMIAIADAVAFLHQRDIFHRDLKPANILLDERGEPRVADFGLALHESEQSWHRDEFAGSPAYMSPEQVRREAHRLDGRSDTWSLGVIFYEMLTGQKPFRGDEKELFEQIKHRDPRPPREIKPDLPDELERICLKCLSKPVALRYSSATDLAQDLRNWLNSLNKETVKQITEKKGQVHIVPKGLRSFDANDAEFFLELLPGPRDRDGLPESLRFWKSRIEETNPQRTFSVGVLHGPSGCGKSSLVKAGLLTRLAPHVESVFVEATPFDTEHRLINGLKRLLPAIPTELSLPEILAAIRARRFNSHRKKYLIVLDQFEQWLHAGNLLDTTPLVDALRHCDGEQLQCLLLVREDFWTGISRFMQQLEIPLQEGLNSALVDRFDPIHARHVLTQFGRAFGRLPDKPEELTSSQENFLDAAVDELSEDGRVICVRLALFGDLFKGKPWHRSVLDQSGGTEGLGVTFLEDTFASKSSPAVLRRHEQAVRKLFQKLLPDIDSEIKGSMQSREVLLEACGYGARPSAFDELMTILDTQLRLVTPTDPEGDAVLDSSPSDKPAMPPRFYQLTHDYLVPSLRTWLTRKQSERMQGRVELRLAEIGAEWGAKPVNKRLPTTWEYVVIRLLTNATTWSPKERAVMRAAARFHRQRWSVTLVVMTFLFALAWKFVSDQRNNAILDRNRQAQALVDAALVAPADAVPYAARNVEALRQNALPILRDKFERNSDDPPQKLRAAMLLTHFGAPQGKYLIESIESAPSQEFSNLVGALKECGTDVLGALHEMVDRAESQENWRHKARLALTLFQLGETAIAQEMLRLGSDPLQRVILIDTVPQWHGSIERLLEGISDSGSGEFRSGVILGMGSIPRNDLPQAELKTAIPKLSTLYCTRPDAATHSAAGWALRQWQCPLPALDSSTDSIRDWQVNSIGMTMIRVPPSGDSNPTPHLPSFWICDRELSIKLFQMFIDDPSCPANAKPPNWTGADLARSPTSEHPVQRVSWFDAVLFCNWLSRRENRKQSYDGEGTSWKLVPGAGGYRLPTESEWEYSCRAGTTTEFVSGNDETFLKSYAVYRSNQTAVCGSKLPNPWGLFDFHGNLYEWCEDWLFQDRERSLRSGGFDYDSSLARSSNRQSNSSNYRSYTIGIRVARDGN